MKTTAHAERQYIEGGVGFVVDRHLHPAGQLGFHPLDHLIAMAGHASSEVAYANAILMARSILDHADDLDIQLSLLSAILHTSPVEMFVIDTVGKAARWNIHLSGVPVPEKITKRLALNACVNAFRQTAERNTLTGTAELATAPSYGNNRAEISDDGQVVQARVEIGYDDAGGSICEFYHTRGADEFDLPGQEIIDAAGGVALSGAMFYPPEMTLGALALGQPPESQRPFDQTVTEVGRCELFRDGALIGEENCQSIAVHTMNDDLIWQITTEFRWPSGATKVLVSNPGFAEASCCSTLEINGNPAEILGWNDSPHPEATCYTDTGSGNVLCFQADE